MTDAEYKTIVAKFNQLQQLELNKKKITKMIEAEGLIPSIIKQPIIDIILAEYNARIEDKRKEIDDIKVTFCGKECDKCLN